jgi:hypothetical protein
MALNHNAVTRLAAVVICFALGSLAVPASACRVLVKYPEHLSGDTPNWAQAYRVVEIIEAHDDHFVVLVKQHFGDMTDVGKRLSLQFIANQEAHAVCSITLDVGKTYLVRSESSNEPLLISRFNWLNVPSTHPKFHDYVRDLELASAI